MRKKIPALGSDKGAEKFVASADLTQYNLKGFKPARFEFERKTVQLNMRLPPPFRTTSERWR